MFISKKNKTTFLSENEMKLILLLKEQGLYEELLHLYGSDKEIISQFVSHRSYLESVINARWAVYN